jgi:hypothetical protein
VVVGGLWLLYKRKLDLNQVVKEASTIKVFFLSLQTGSPALVFFVIGGRGVGRTKMSRDAARAFRRTSRPECSFLPANYQGVVQETPQGASPTRMLSLGNA